MKKILIIFLIFLLAGISKLHAQYIACVGDDIIIPSVAPAPTTGGIRVHYAATSLTGNAPSVATSEVIGAHTYTLMSSTACPGSNYNFSLHCAFPGTYTIYLAYKWYDVSCNSGIPHYVENGSVTVTVYENLPDAAGAITGSTSVCQGQNTVGYSIYLVPNTSSYHWTYSGSGVTISNPSSRVTTIDFSSSATSGTLTVHALNACGNGTSASIAITVNTPPATPGAITGAASVCQGSLNNPYSIVSLPSATSYTWSYSGTGQSITNANTSTPTITFSSSATSGTLSVSGVNSCGTGTAATKYITIKTPPPTPFSISGDTAVCQGSINNAYGTTSLPTATSYTWTYSGTGQTITNGTTASPTINFSSVATSGTLTVRSVNACGTSLPNNLHITLKPLPSAAGAITGQDIVCQNQNNVPYSVASIPSATSYLWTYSGSGVNIANPTSRTPTITFYYNATSGTLAVNGINACGTGSIATKNITVTPLPSASGAITGSNTVCQGQNNVSYSVVAIPNATSYVWTYSGTGAFISNSTSRTPTINFSATATDGTLTVKGTNICGDGTFASMSIMVRPTPGPADAISGYSNVCANSTNNNYSTFSSSATSYHWTYGGLGETITDSTSAAPYINFSSSATSGNLVVTGVNVCGTGPSTSMFITIDQPPIAASPIVGNNVVCTDLHTYHYSIDAISGAQSYFWNYSGSNVAISNNANEVTLYFYSNATSGILSVYANNFCGDGIADTMAITVFGTVAPAGQITGNSSVCPGQNNLSYSVPAIANATGYTWTYSGSGVTTTFSISRTPTLSFSTTATSGTLTVRGYNACGIGTASTFNIIVNPLPGTGIITGAASVCQGANNVPYSVSVPNATSYLWNLSGIGGTIYNGTTDNPTISFSNDATVSYISVYGINACGSSELIDKTITMNNLPVAAGNITGNSFICQGANNVAYSVPAIADATTYLWTYSGTGATINNANTRTPTISFSGTATSGTLSVCGVNSCGNGIAKTLSVTIGSIPSVTAAITGNTSVCQGQEFVPFSVPVIANATSYSWTYGGTGATISGSSSTSNITFSPTATSGTLSVNGVNACGVGTPSTLAITVISPVGAAGAIAGSTTACTGQDNVIYSVPAIANAVSYNWSYSGTGVTITNGTTRTPTLSFSATATTGTLSVCGINACGNGSTSVKGITINATPDAPIIGSITQPSCMLATATVAVSGLPASGTWTINPGGITGTGNSTTITGLASGSYNFTVNNSAGCVSDASVNVVVNAQPETPVVANQSISIITAGTFVVAPAGVPAGTTYTWTAPTYTGGVTGGSAQSIPQSEISGTLSIPSGSGTASYIVTPVSGPCTGNPFTVTVNVTTACVGVTIGTQPTNTSMCAGLGNATFTIHTNGTYPITYQWQYYNGSSWVSVSDGTPNGAVYSNETGETLGISGITSVGNFNYRCYVTNCSAANNATSNSVLLAVKTTPTAPTIGTITQTTCLQSTGDVVLNGLPSSGTWTLNPGNISGTGNSAAITGLAAGTYNYTVTNSACCTSLQSANVVINTQPALPAAPIIGAISQPTCNLQTGSVILNGLPSSGSWTINPGNIMGSGISDTLHGLTTGSYTFTVAASAGCVSGPSAYVVIDFPPAATLAPVIQSIVQTTCEETTGSVELTSLPAGDWVVNPGNITGGTINTSIAGLAPGTYYYTVTNSLGCVSAASAAVIINPQPIPPIVSLGSDLILCADETVTLDAGNPGANYFWNENATTTQLITIDSSGHGTSSFPVWVTVNNGCFASDTIIITFDPCTGIDETESAAVSVYPNPTDGLVYISTAGNSSLMVQLINNEGSVLYSGPANELRGTTEVRELDLSSYATGLYFIRLSSNSTVKVIKIVNH